MVHRTERPTEKYKPWHLSFHISFPRRAGHISLKKTKRKVFLLVQVWIECFKVKAWSCSGGVGAGGECERITSNRVVSVLKSIDSGSRLLTSSAALKPAQMPSISLCPRVCPASQAQSIAYPAFQLTRYCPQVAYQPHLASPAGLCHCKASYHIRSRKRKYCI